MTKNEESIMEKNAQAMVEAFHRMFEIVVQQTPALVDDQTRALRIRLIHEEFEELKEVMAKNDLVGIAKEMADLLYVVYGTAVSYGIDMDTVFREVHRSNMSKVGGYKREDGKWVKPATYSPAAIEPILAEQVGVQNERRRESSDRVLGNGLSPVELRAGQ
jgi:predicted HAD superfamily Cof-like phosphohydrolase